MDAAQPERDFELERHALWGEIRDRFVWGDHRRVQELFMDLTRVRQEEGRAKKTDPTPL